MNGASRALARSEALSVALWVEARPAGAISGPSSPMEPVCGAFFTCVDDAPTLPSGSQLESLDCADLEDALSSSAIWAAKFGAAAFESLAGLAPPLALDLDLVGLERLIDWLIGL